MIAEDKESASKKAEIRTLVFIFALAASFLVWGFLLFHTIGDKGPPPWDFGVVQDIPGQSSYSTHPPRQGKGTEPEPQHVSRKPSKALTEVQKEKP